MAFVTPQGDSREVVRNRAANLIGITRCSKSRHNNYYDCVKFS